MKTLNPLTKNLQRFLEKKGWTIPQFARDLENADIHVDEKSVRKWYNGDNYPQTETLIQLSDFLGVSMDVLVKSDITEFGCEKFDDLSQEEKETLYRLCTSKNVYFTVEISPETLHIKPDMMAEIEFDEAFRSAALKALKKTRTKDFLYDLLKKDGLLNRARKSEPDTDRILDELTEEACKYLNIAIRESDERTEPELYDSAKQTLNEKDFELNKVLAEIHFDNDDETEDKTPLKESDYNIIREETTAYNTYYTAPGVAVLSRSDLINGFGTDMTSLKGLELIASAVRQEERLKQQFFKFLIDKKIVNDIPEGNYVNKLIDGEFSYSAYSCSVELGLTEEERLYFLRKYANELLLRAYFPSSKKESEND